MEEEKVKDIRPYIWENININTENKEKERNVSSELIYCREI